MPFLDQQDQSLPVFVRGGGDQLVDLRQGERLSIRRDGFRQFHRRDGVLVDEPEVLGPAQGAAQGHDLDDDGLGGLAPERA